MGDVALGADLRVAPSCETLGAGVDRFAGGLFLSPSFLPAIYLYLSIYLPHYFLSFLVPFELCPVVRFNPSPRCVAPRQEELAVPLVPDLNTPLSEYDGRDHHHDGRDLRSTFTHGAAGDGQ